MPLVSQAADSYIITQQTIDELLVNNQATLDQWRPLFVQEGYNNNFVRWCHEYYASLKGQDDRGDLSLYPHIMMSLAMAYQRLGQPEELQQYLQNMLDRQYYLWSGWLDSDYYLHKKTALASLAVLLSDNRAENLSAQVIAATHKAFADNGYPLLGPATGWSQAQSLAIYLYWQDNEPVKQRVLSFINWLAATASQDRFWAPLENTKMATLPNKISDWPEVNNDWKDNLHFYNIPSRNTWGEQVSVLRPRQDITIWLRHRQSISAWRLPEIQYSNGDIIMKVGAEPWLISPGNLLDFNYFDKPSFHNVAMGGWRNLLSAIWRWLGGSAQRLSYQDAIADQAQVDLVGNITRTVETDNNGMVVADIASYKFQQWWQINGELIGRSIAGDKVILSWQMSNGQLIQELSGVYQVELSTGQHVAVDGSIKNHTRVQVTGMDIVSRFDW